MANFQLAIGLAGRAEREKRDSICRRLSVHLTIAVGKFHGSLLLHPVNGGNYQEPAGRGPAALRRDYLKTWVWREKRERERERGGTAEGSGRGLIMQTYRQISQISSSPTSSLAVYVCVCVCFLSTKNHKCTYVRTLVGRMSLSVGLIGIRGVIIQALRHCSMLMTGHTHTHTHTRMQTHTQTCTDADTHTHTHTHTHGERKLRKSGTTKVGRIFRDKSFYWWTLDTRIFFLYI